MSIYCPFRARCLTHRDKPPCFAVMAHTGHLQNQTIKKTEIPCVKAHLHARFPESDTLQVLLGIPMA